MATFRLLAVYSVRALGMLPAFFVSAAANKWLLVLEESTESVPLDLQARDRTGFAVGFWIFQHARL